MIKRKIKNTMNFITKSGELFTLGNDALRFLFGNKPALELGIDFNSKDERYLESAKLLAPRLSVFIKKKIYFKVYMFGGHKRIILSKFPIEREIFTNKEIGLILGIPKCCVKKYCEEDDGKGASTFSALRYLNQCKELKIKKDYFAVGLDYYSAQTRLGFVPCSPNCKNALKIYKEFKRIDEALNHA